VDDRVVRCSQHGWEFDIIAGKPLYDWPGRVATYSVEVDENGNLVLLL
jgi:nitrite reductase/ring-hydroxylating ferredoxin subunit